MNVKATHHHALDWTTCSLLKCINFSEELKASIFRSQVEAKGIFCLLCSEFLTSQTYTKK